MPHPGHRHQPEGQAGRVPRPGPLRQPVPGVLGACCWPASTASRTRSSRPSRSTRTSTSCRPRRHASVAQVPASLRRGPGRAGGRPRLPARGRRLHAGPDRDRGSTSRRPTTRSPLPASAPHEFEMYFDVDRRSRRPDRRPLSPFQGGAPSCGRRRRGRSPSQGACGCRDHAYDTVVRVRRREWPRCTSATTRTASTTRWAEGAEYKEPSARARMLAARWKEPSGQVPFRADPDHVAPGAGRGRPGVSTAVWSSRCVAAVIVLLGYINAPGAVLGPV